MCKVFGLSNVLALNKLDPVFSIICEDLLKLNINVLWDKESLLVFYMNKQ